MIWSRYEERKFGSGKNGYGSGRGRKKTKGEVVERDCDVLVCVCE